MIKNKYDVPLAVLEELKNLKQIEGNLFKRVKTKESLIRFEHVNPLSDSYFEIKTYSVGNDIVHFEFEFKPTSKFNLNVNRLTARGKIVPSYLKNWESILEGYDDHEDESDDPIVKQYEKEFYEDYIEILEQNADSTFFSYDQQLKLDGYLEKVALLLEEGKTEKNASQVDEIISDLRELRETQTVLTKNKVLKGLSKIWAKTRKVGISLLKKVYEEFTKEAIKRLVSGHLDDIGNLMN
ncbi:MAG: hypothetical protein EOP56_13840 [Sphingobacteriales bacterium]|nr:MAG: hypothetical protein EOP56_13840 [Sphingobacteriales bacterium]